MIRFSRARGCCEGYGVMVHHLGDGRGWDIQDDLWRVGRERRLRIDGFGRDRRTHAFLAEAHCNQDTTDNTDANLADFCQRCDMIHDRPERRRRWRTLFPKDAIKTLNRTPF